MPPSQQGEQPYYDAAIVRIPHNAELRLLKGLSYEGLGLKKRRGIPGTRALGRHQKAPNTRNAYGLISAAARVAACRLLHWNRVCCDQ
jgi:hypothetical protein